MYLEVIATSVADVRLINQSKANQIELCTNLEVGGLTPDYPVIRAACEVAKIPIRVMIRRNPHSFCPTNDEFQQLQEDIAFVKTTKATGIVCGILTKDNLIDIEKMKIIIKLARPLHVTFHRAFDHIKNQKAAIDTIVMLGIDTVLTSGGPGRAVNYLRQLKHLIDLNQPILILVGSGVTTDNYQQFHKQKITNLHIGRAARINSSYQLPISIQQINQFLSK